MTLQHLLEAVREMRKLQIAYFAEKEPDEKAYLLRKCKAAERGVDSLIEEEAQTGQEALAL